VAQSEQNNTNGGAVYFVPRCETLRQLKGKSMNDLSKAADVDRSRITLIERKQPVSGNVAGKVFQALNNWHESTLVYESEVTKTLDLRRKIVKSDK
jgi:transcriptional regulator with XRE-family HTH domain